MMTAAWVAGACLVTALLVAGVRRSPLWVWVLVFGGLGATLPLFGALLGGPITVFGFVKTVSVGAAGLGIAAMRAGWWPERVHTVLWVVLAVNILEAVAAEAGGGVHLYNPIAGVLLLACMAGPSSLSIDHTGDPPEVNWNLGWDWILAYTVWNAVFVYSSGAPGEPKGIWMWVAVAHLGVPLVLTFGRSERWAELRALALFFVVCWVDLVRVEPWVQHSEGAFSEPVALGVHLASLVLVLGVCARHLLDPTAPPSVLRRLASR